MIAFCAYRLLHRDTGIHPERHRSRGRPCTIRSDLRTELQGIFQGRLQIGKRDSGSGARQRGEPDDESLILKKTCSKCVTSDAQSDI